MKNRFWKTLAIIAGLLIIGAGIYFGVKYIVNDIQKKGADRAANENRVILQEETAQTEKAQTAANENTVLTPAPDITSTQISSGTVLVDVSEIVENVMPSVVSIVDTVEYKQSQTYNPYNYFFGGGKSSSQTQELPYSGSGVIVGSRDGRLLIVTNAHVVNNEETTSAYTITSKELTVTFVDGTSADAVVLGMDTEADLAVIYVELGKLSDETKSAIKTAVIGNSDEIKIGAGVIAIGNALGYGQSVTTGIISAKDRQVTIDNITRSLMQTDAAINPGNSGGGLFDAQGRLIGINSAKTSSTSVEGMGFAIPITSAQAIIEDLMNKEVVAEEDRGYLGVSGSTVPDNYIAQYGYPAGVVVNNIVADSPAEKAGLQYYDIITEVNGKPVTSMDSLKKEINSYKAGTTVELTVMRPEGRNFREMKAEATLVTYEEISGNLPEEAPENVPETEEAPETDEDENPFQSIWDWFFNH
ncbi:MAG: trypsin-like peptidase domain-containing protein [Lachnospiraceae bacterium]|nr:trypsin-like peptidase domain-containing protein [Lachnospiraceae bacterium]